MVKNVKKKTSTITNVNPAWCWAHNGNDHDFMSKQQRAEPRAHRDSHGDQQRTFWEPSDAQNSA